MRIGWSTADITPSRPVVLRGQFHARISKYVNDPLLATVLAIEGKSGNDGRDQAVMVSCDLADVPNTVRDRLRETLKPQLPDLDVSKIFLNATHTHTAPQIEEGIYPPQGPDVMTPTEYADFFLKQVADAVVQAWQSRAPAGVSWAYGHAVIGHNRRISYFGGASKMYGKTDQPDFECVEGYEDHGVDMLFTWDKDRNMTGIVLNIACPSQETEGQWYVSADFWHEVRLELRKHCGEGLSVLPQCGAAGDQSPHLLLHKAAEQRMLQKRGLTARQEFGRRLANAVKDCIEIAKGDIQTDPPFKHIMRKLQLPARMITKEEYDAARQTCEKLSKEKPANPPGAGSLRVPPGAELKAPQSGAAPDLIASSRHFVMQRRNKRIMTAYQEQLSPRRTYEMELHAIRLGDIAICTNPFELFLDYGLRIKARSKALQTFVVQLAGPCSYLPTAKAVAGKGYGAEAVDNRVGPEGGQELVEKTLEAIHELWSA